MKVSHLLPIACAGLLLAGTALAQTPSDAPDPHDHGAPATAATSTDESSSQDLAPLAAGSGSDMMMSPKMMAMMMQMMAQHHPGGSMMQGGMPQSGPAAPQAGLEVILGQPSGPAAETTPELVREWLQKQLDVLGNPRLVLGAISTTDDGSIVAEIRTVDGALVQKMSFNRYPGFVRQIE